MKNWKTTIFGCLTAAGAGMSQQPGTVGTVGQIISIVGPLLLGIFAKDSNVTGGNIVQGEAK